LAQNGHSGASDQCMALLRVTRAVPIVFAAVTDPVGLGIVQNLARPGGNATGFLTAEFGFGAKLLELLKEISPGVRRVSVLTELDNPSAAPQFAAIQSVAPSMGVEPKLLGSNDIERGISDFARAGDGGLIALRLFQVIAHRKLIIKRLSFAHICHRRRPDLLRTRRGRWVSTGSVVC
jgi:ABC transporter substrate binding protein